MRNFRRAALWMSGGSLRLRSPCQMRSVSASSKLQITIHRFYMYNMHEVNDFQPDWNEEEST
jgi:hypothetical protein